MKHTSVEWGGRTWWSTDRDPYFRRSEGGRMLKLHREVWKAAHGPISAGVCIHHINGDKRDNRVENLEAIGSAAHKTLHGVARADDQRAVLARARPSFVFPRRCAICGEGTTARWRAKPVYCSDVCRKESQKLARARYDARVRATRQEST